MSTFSFELLRPDSLGVLTSTARVVQEAAQVRIDPAAILRFAESSRGLITPTAADDPLHCTFLPPRRLLNYLLVLEALNFCFWDDEPRWRVEWNGERYDGYWALAAALRRAIRVDATPFWDARWMAQADERAVAHLLRGEGHAIPMLVERVANLRQAGEVLMSRWSGEFANIVQAAGSDAGVLVKLIVREFPSFRDEAVWHSPRDSQAYPILFLKRAQICVADLTRLLPDHPLGEITGLAHLTAFADYKVPQVLRKLGILIYRDALAARVDTQQPLAAGAAEELEIRAATLWACEWISQALMDGDNGTVHAGDVDYRLWVMGQDKTGLRPYHRTRTIFY